MSTKARSAQGAAESLFFQVFLTSRDKVFRNKESEGEFFQTYPYAAQLHHRVMQPPCSTQESCDHESCNGCHLACTAVHAAIMEAIGQRWPEDQPPSVERIQSILGPRN